MQDPVKLDIDHVITVLERLRDNGVVKVVLPSWLGIVNSNGIEMHVEDHLEKASSI